MTLWPFALVGASLVSVVILIGVFSLAITVFWLWMLIDALTNKKLKGTDLLVWILVILFLGIIGAVIYYFIVKRKG